MGVSIQATTDQILSAETTISTNKHLVYRNANGCHGNVAMDTNGSLFEGSLHLFQELSRNI